MAFGTKPVVPYMPCVLGDLAMQGEGNSTLVDGLVNMVKIEMVGARVYEALRFQPAEYDVEQDRSLVMYFLSTELTLDEDDLYGESQRREPVGGGAKADRSSRKFFPKSMQLLSSAAPGRLIPRARANSVYSQPLISRLSVAPLKTNSDPTTGSTAATAMGAPTSASPSTTSSAAAQARPQRSTLSELGMAKLQILSMHQSVANVQPGSAKTATGHRKRLHRSESWPPKMMRSNDPSFFVPSASPAVSETLSTEPDRAVRLSLLEPLHTPPQSPARKASGGPPPSQASSGQSSPNSQRGSLRRTSNSELPNCKNILHNIARTFVVFV